ncbi:hypothetical protein DTO164E3_8079 [Paecilomyces variotii]|nr:hypothetical protein DTO164E3_8079 [Paecilomyces variotii]KAJ9349490.1 hypothetical protein DTO027B9_7530 [Paecilomyces variotii]KAJ9410474.1 hypothetical protein DTO045G8_1937 [Paecilomyces variotii]
MRSITAFLTGLAVLTSNTALISAATFTLSNGKLGGCIIAMTNACGCTGWGYIGDANCEQLNDEETVSGICVSNDETLINFGRANVPVAYGNDDGSCGVGCDFGSKAAGSTWSA